MLETLLNGRLDTWYEWTVIILVGFPIWGTILYLFSLLVAKIINTTYFRKLT